MAIPESAILLGVAELLIKRWAPKLKGDLSGHLPTDLELADGLRRLIISDDQFGDLFSGITDPKKIDLAAVEGIIKGLQQGIGALKVDGILGSSTLSELLKSLLCLKQLPIPTTEVSEDFRKMIEKKGGDPNAENWYLYYVEELPVVPGPVSADILVKNAWSLWQKYANVKVERLPRRLRDSANVVIKTTDLPDSILGRAPVGNPPSRFVMEIEMDRTRTWDAVMFEGAVAHEIGHVLGLEHQAVPGLLMSEYVKRDWRDHFEIDGERAAELAWLGKAPTIKRKKKHRGRFDELRFDDEDENGDE